MKDMKNRIVVMIMAAVFALPAMAGWITQEQKDATVQQAVFQSTSTLQGSGSAYSSTPALEADGTASAPSGAAGGPRRIGGLPGTGGGTSEGMPDNSKVGDNTPIGDAVLPLMLMAAAGAGIIALRRRKTTVDCRQ